MTGIIFINRTQYSNTELPERKKVTITNVHNYYRSLLSCALQQR